MPDILIADDHLTVRLGIRALVEEVSGKCQIDFAVDGPMLFSKLKKKNYDMLITDLNMQKTLRPELRCISASRILSVSEVDGEFAAFPNPAGERLTVQIGKKYIGNLVNGASQ